MSRTQELTYEPILMPTIKTRTLPSGSLEITNVAPTVNNNKTVKIIEFDTILSRFKFK